MSRISSPTLPSAPVSFPSPSDFECVVCLCDYPTSQIHLTCEHQHGVCASCFLSFVQINCTERTLPLLCPLKECSVLLPDASIAAILGSLGDAEALAAFEQASVYACLAEEKAIICPVCNQYAVLYEAPDDEFWKRVLKRQDAKVNTERSEITEQLEITLRNLENDFARQLDQILSNKASTISIVRNKHHRDLEQKCEQILETQEKERGDFFLEEKVVVPAFLSAAEIREMHQLSMIRMRNPAEEERFQALTDAYASCREHFARSENPREQARKAELSRIRVAFAEEFASKIAADVSEIEARFSIEIEQFYERKKQTIEATLKPLQEKLERLSRRDPEEWRSIAASLRKDDMDSKSIDSKSVASSKLPPAHKTWFKWRKQKSPSSPGSSPSFIVESSTGSELQISSSIKFFVCERLGCDGAFCVSCMKPTTKQSLSDHICSLNELDVLHEQILDVLAKASSRKCPNCGFSGIKDLACKTLSTLVQDSDPSQVLISHARDVRFAGVMFVELLSLIYLEASQPTMNGIWIHLQMTRNVQCIFISSTEMSWRAREEAEILQDLWLLSILSYKEMQF